VLGGPTVPSVIISAGTRGVSVNRNRLVMSLNRLVGFFMIFSTGHFLIVISTYGRNRAILKASRFLPLVEMTNNPIIKRSGNEVSLLRGLQINDNVDLIW